LQLYMYPKRKNSLQTVIRLQAVLMQKWNRQAGS